jgi:AcrR family transcriptional regulator
LSPRRSENRERMVVATAELLREYGASATSIDRVLLHSGASRGSVYHYFPEGRSQLIGEAVDLAGECIGRKFEAMAEAGDPVRSLDAFFEHWRARLLENGFRAGCTVVAVAVETNDEAPQLVQSAAAIFGRWQDALTAMLVRGGLPQERGRRLAVMIVAAVEGAIVLCRAQQSTDPLDATAAELHDLLVGALSG